MESIGVIRIVWGLCRDYKDYVLELCWDNGKENGNYYIIKGLGFRVRRT